jgi:hypothetical protein
MGFGGGAGWMAAKGDGVEVDDPDEDDAGVDDGADADAGV